MSKETFSHSRCSLVMECPRAYFHKYEEGLEPLVYEAPPMTAGSVMHEALHAYYAHGMDVGYALVALHNVYKAAPAGRFEYMTPGHLEVVLRNYHDEYGEREPYKVIRTAEDQLEGVIAGLPFTGIPDLIAMDKGDLIVVDHKCTSGYLGEALYMRAKMQYQLKLYAILVYQNTGDLPSGGVINAVYIGQYASSPKSKAAKFARYRVDFKESDFEEAEMWVARATDTIEYYRSWQDSPAEDGWPQNPSDRCARCPYLELCESTPRLRPLKKATKFQVRPTEEESEDDPIQ